MVTAIIYFLWYLFLKMKGRNWIAISFINEHTYLFSNYVYVIPKLTCFPVGYFKVLLEGLSLNHVDRFQIFGHFWPPSPLWTILQNKAYVVIWTFCKPPSPCLVHMVYECAPMAMQVSVMSSCDCGDPYRSHNQTHGKILPTYLIYIIWSETL